MRSSARRLVRCGNPRRRAGPVVSASSVISVVRRFRVRGGIETLLEATKAYQRLTRREPGNVRCELWQTAGDERSFTLLEVFRDGFARTQHALSAHAQSWQLVVTPLIDGHIHDEQSEAKVLDAVPPPLPVRSRPALESSSPFGGALYVAGESGAARPKVLQLTLDVETIEVAAARDHIPLRAAQPCAVLAAFAIGAGGAHGICRTVYRFKPPQKLPASLLGSQRLLDAPLSIDKLPLSVCIVAISVEENGGSDVQQLYQALADSHDLSFWARTESCPTPLSLNECSEAATFDGVAHRVEVLRRGQTLADLVHDDTWAGAALGCFRLSGANADRRARFHTAAEDGKNDWLMTLRCRVA
jgi:quinol monooxygenase YgiN